MSTTINDVREVLEDVRDQLGYQAAKRIVRDIGKAEMLSDVPERLWDAVIVAAHGRLSPTPSDRLSSRAADLYSSMQALVQLKGTIMAAIDDLKNAVDSAVGEMTKAADFIRNHPAAQNDAALADMANRLAAAAQALSGVDVDTVATMAGTATGAAGNDTTGGGAATG